MSDADTLDAPERADCPDCGKQVPVNKDGSLRKHPCAVPESPGEDAAAEPVEVVDDPEPEGTPQPEAAAETPRRRRKYCRVPNCGRAPRDNGLCTSHRLHTHLVS